MNQFRRWTLDRHKYMSEPEVKKLKRTITDKALADLVEKFKKRTQKPEVTFVSLSGSFDGPWACLESPRRSLCRPWGILGDGKVDPEVSPWLQLLRPSPLILFIYDL